MDCRHILIYERSEEQWENKTIKDYLEAVSRYTEDIDGYYKNTNQEIDLEKVD